MPVFVIVIESVLLYGGLAALVVINRRRLDPTTWVPDPTLRIIWGGWLLTLVALAPLSYQYHDMQVWMGSVHRLLDGEHLPSLYVYLPLYAEVLAALYYPFDLLGLDRGDIVLSYIIHLPPLLTYAYVPKLMARMLPGAPLQAPLGIVLGPVTILYLFFGTNHIVMFGCLLLAIYFAMRQQWVLAGVWAGIGCYKFLLFPTVAVLGLIILWRCGLRSAVRYALGGIASFVPSVLYYVYDSGYLQRTVENLGAIGGHSNHIEEFHFLYFVKQIPAINWDSFQNAYVDAHVWFIGAVLSAVLVLVLFRLNRLNTFQTLGIVSALVAIVALEPYRLEPAIGLLWMDAVHRRDYRVQGALWGVLLLHAAAWYRYANSRYLAFTTLDLDRVWAYKGLWIGLALLVVVVLVLFSKPSEELWEDG